MQDSTRHRQHCPLPTPLPGPGTGRPAGSPLPAGPRATQQAPHLCCPHSGAAERLLLAHRAHGFLLKALLSPSVHFPFPVSVTCMMMNISRASAHLVGFLWYLSLNKNFYL